MPRMTREKPLMLLIFVLFAGGCALSGQKPAKKQVSQRVKAAYDHLNSTEGGKLLAEAIDKHGGLTQWFAGETLRFRWTYYMTDMGPNVVLDSTQTIDLWSSRAVHEWHGKGLNGHENIRFGWDGNQAWISPADAKTLVPHHFWSLTPYYFVGIPFVLADPGTNHEKLGTIHFEGKNYLQVKVTFSSGVGATPDDYYVVLIDPDSKMVRAVRYIVTDAVVMKDKPIIEKLITYEDYKLVNDIYLPQAHRSFAVDTTGKSPVIGQQIRTSKVSELGFKVPADFEAPSQ